MSSEDDIFLKTFNQMITVLNELHTTIKLLKKSVEVIQLSIDGLGSGLTDINAQLLELNKKFDVSIKLNSTSTSYEQKQTEKKPEKTPTKAETQKVEIKSSALSPSSSNAHHPIFINLINKINNASSHKEVGDILIEGLELIESSFSFSRVFYEIRRIGNSLIRKGESDFTPNDKMELIEKIIDWETRVTE
ncbi:MAG: hypothetical protein JXA54_03715 [Candidatus Heimdallarchaeota archaeon]|nr:hypothetical protein [Candidatus Heimdallarchaeota archaeon]